MSFSKLTLEVYRGNVPEPAELLPVLFNPNRITWQKQVPWNVVPQAESNTSLTQFTHGQPSTLHLELFFDTYAARSDVSRSTSRIYQLTSVRGSGAEEQPPPRLRLRWGQFDFQALYWVLVQIDQNFTLFLEDGTPVRATLACTFLEKENSDSLARDAQGAAAAASAGGDIASHLVQGGEPLSAIHGRHTGDPAAWRQTARANQIWNPRRLVTGAQLLVPRSPRRSPR